MPDTSPSTVVDAAQQGEAAASALPQADAGGTSPIALGWVYSAFFLSGFAALVYQLAWQRVLFTLYGTNVESVTLVVTAFMLGLGLGSLLGGVLSERRQWPLFALFGGMETTIGIFGLFSLRLFEAVGRWTLGLSTLQTGLAAFLLLLFPTMLMGATLPVLVAQLVRRSGNVGRSLGLLYFINTLGSAVAALAAALLLLGALGLHNSVRLAALCSVSAGASVLVPSLLGGRRR